MKPYVNQQIGTNFSKLQQSVILQLFILYETKAIVAAINTTTEKCKWHRELSDVYVK